MHDAAMHFVIFPKTHFKPDNCQTLRGRIHINFIAMGNRNPTRSGRLTPDPEGRYCNLCKPCQCLGSLCNCYVQFNHLFPEPDTALSKLEVKQTRSVSTSIQILLFLSMAIQLNTPVTSPIASAQQYFQYLSRWERINCQLLTCRYDT
jgi:hypothetical protein